MITPSFKEYDRAFHKGHKCTILRVKTYCVCCDRPLDDTKYAIKYDSGKPLDHHVPESELKYLTRG